MEHEPRAVFETLFGDSVGGDLAARETQRRRDRSFTFMLVRELSLRAYPETGVPDMHHPLSHHGNNAANLKRLATVNAFHVRLLAYYAQRLQSTADGNGSLLDHTLLLYGSGMGDPNNHDTRDLPILLLGPGHITGGRRVRYPKDTPLSNLYLTILDILGIPVEQFGNSTGALPLSIRVGRCSQESHDVKSCVGGGMIRTSASDRTGTAQKCTALFPPS